MKERAEVVLAKKKRAFKIFKYEAEIDDESTQSELAIRLGVRRETVNVWKKEWKQSLLLSIQRTKPRTDKVSPKEET